MTQGPYPLEIEPGEAARMNRKARERYLELACWPDPEEEAEMEAAWDATDNPTRPRDRELLP